MLIIYDAEKVSAEIVDIDAEFSQILINPDETLNKIIKSIDGGTLLDSNVFSDRFGNRLYLSELSTGCKAAICVYCNPDKIVDLQECGLNARDAVFNYCENGKILLHDFGVTVVDAGSRQTPVIYNSTEYTIAELNEVVL